MQGEVEDTGVHGTEEAGEDVAVPTLEHVEVEDDNSEEGTLLGAPRKNRPPGEKRPYIDKHVPDWLVLSFDSTISKAHPLARMLGGRLLRGATLSNDKILVNAVDLVEACTELMATLAVASFFPCTSIFTFSGRSLGGLGVIPGEGPSD